MPTDTPKIALSLALVACACGASATAPERIAATVPLALVGATVLPMTTSVVLANQTIIVRNGAISAIGPSASVEVPSDARVIDLRGRFIMPGLVDMHVHNAIRDAQLYVPAGITTVRNLWGFPSLQKFAAVVKDTSIDVPTILMVSPGIDGKPASWPYTRFLENPATVRDSLNTIVGEGWTTFKIYDRLPAAAFDSIIAVAKQLKVPVIGHVPWSISIQHALASGMHEVEHLSGYDAAISGGGPFGPRDWSAIDQAKIPALVAATVAAQTWNCATLAIYSEIYRRSAPAERDAAVRNRRIVVRALADGGAKLIVGTDSGIDIVPAGTTIIDEIEEHVLAGLTPYAALRAATANAAESVGRVGEFGTIVAGARADLLVLDRNPLEERATLRSPRAVVLRGSWIGYR